MAAQANYDDLLRNGAKHFAKGVCGRSDWKLYYANDALRDLLGLKERPHENALHDWLAQGQFEEMEGEARQGENGSLIFRHSAGQVYLICWWNSGAREDKNRDLLCFSIQALPLALLSQSAQHAMRELDSILDFIHDGIWVIDGNGITRRINRSMERIAGIRADEVVGRHVSEPLREGRFKTCVTLHALQTRHTVTLFDDYSNGKRCLNTSTPIFDSSGNVWRVIAAIRDMTELEELKNRLSNLEVEALAYRLRAQGLENETHGGMLGQSPVLLRVQQDITKAAQTDAVTLILGETGTGKSLAAKNIHDLSSRAQKPFITVNCGAIPASLMESELFGYEKGAFTGAAKTGKPGMVELAAGGTLLLDEIGELSLPMQAKLLHMLDGQPVYRVGGTKPITMDARIIAATNRPLDKMVTAGTFREDLFYRLRVLCVDMPPLRERKDDILLLAWHFLQKINGRAGIRKKLDPRVEKLFLAYSWPGNVRELQSVLQSLVTLCEHEIITPADLPSYLCKDSCEKHAKTSHPQRLNEAVEELESRMLAAALAETGSTYKAARRLGISQSSVVRKSKKYGIGQIETAVSADRNNNPAQNGADLQKKAGGDLALGNS